MATPAQETTTRRMITAAAAVAVAAALVLAGCGKDGDKDATPTKKKATTTTTSTSTSSTTPATSTTATSTTVASSTTVDGKDGGNDETDPSIPDDQNPEGDLETSQLDTLPSGTHYGYLKGIMSGYVEGQAVSIVEFDKVEFLTGQAAVDAAHKAGAIPPEQDYVENDYFIVNDNPMLRKLAVVPDAQVSTVSGGSSTPQPSSISEAAASGGLYKILVQNVRGITTITSVEGVFLP